MTVLRPYQERGIGRARYQYSQGSRAICIIAPCGSGKTIIGATIAANAAATGKVLWLAHRQELVDQARSKLPPGVRVETVQSLLASGERPPATVVVLDECVTGDTIIGGKRADQIRVGDLVESWNGKDICFRPVIHVFVNRPHSIITLMSNGHRVNVTGNHPIWVEGKGYEPADQVKVGDVFLVQNESCQAVSTRTNDEVLLQGMFGDGAGGSVHRQIAPTTTMRYVRTPGEENHTGMGQYLLRDVREQEAFGDDGTNQPQVCFCKDEGSQPDARRQDTSGRECNSQADRPPTSRQGRQWPWHDYATTGATGVTRDKLGCRVHCPAGATAGGIPNALQVRPGEREPEGSHRNRREFSLRPESAISRRAQGRTARLARVDSVEVHQPTSDGTFGGVCADGLVYNFEVEGDHNYFANGILTHNCHHYVAEEWRTVADSYRDVLRIGLTATPERSDGTPLGDMFTSMVEVASYSELLAGGWIVPCDVYAPAARYRSLSEKPEEAVLKYADGRKTILFASTVEEARRVAAALPAAMCVDGETPGDVRLSAIQAFRSGALQTLTNVYVLTEGFDAPETSVCVLARGFSHPSTFLQCVGRALRPAPGKTRATVIDLCGVVNEQGFPTSDRTYSLEGEGIRLDGGKKSKIILWQCKFCGFCIGKEPDGRMCPECGNKMPEPKALTVARRRLERKEENACATIDTKTREWRRLQALARAKGYKRGWAFVVFQSKYGEAPPRS